MLSTANFHSLSVICSYSLAVQKTGMASWLLSFFYALAFYLEEIDMTLTGFVNPKTLEK